MIAGVKVVLGRQPRNARYAPWGLTALSAKSILGYDFSYSGHPVVPIRRMYGLKTNMLYRASSLGFVRLHIQSPAKM